MSRAVPHSSTGAYSASSMADENVFFMRVDEPVEVRKHLLESARVVLHSLQRYERFKDVRAKKAEQIIQLRGVIKEINQLFVQLRSHLPDAAPGATVKELTRVAKRDAADSEREPHRRHLNVDKSVEKLHHQLKAIEHRLNSLA